MHYNLQSRLSIFLSLALLIFSGCGAPETENIFALWPDGKTETFSYEIITYYPAVNKSANQIVISKSDIDSTLTIHQHLKINNETLIIDSREKYNIASLALINSENNFTFKGELYENYGLQSLNITARPRGDSLEIISSDNIKISTVIPADNNLVTGLGATLRSRTMNFEIGRAVEYNQVNLINLATGEFTVETIRDSVLGLENVALASGSFECYKVRKLMPDIVGYSYYTADTNHLPIMIEAYDRASTRRIMNISLIKYESD